jgi:hypothetical protein
VPFPFDPAPATLWTLTLDDKLAACEIAFVPTGVEARITRNSDQTFLDQHLRPCVLTVAVCIDPQLPVVAVVGGDAYGDRGDGER